MNHSPKTLYTIDSEQLFQEKTRAHLQRGQQKTSTLQMSLQMTTSPKTILSQYYTSSKSGLAHNLKTSFQRYRLEIVTFYVDP